jgi:hypothetical protein
MKEISVGDFLDPTLEFVDPAQGRLSTIHGLDRDDAVAGDLDCRLDASTTHVVGVEVEAASSELQVAQHVVCSPLVIVLEEPAGVPTRSTVVEAQEAEHVDERKGKALHVILGHLQREAHMAVVAGCRRLDLGIDDLEIHKGAGPDQFVLDGFVLVGHGAEGSPNSSRVGDFHMHLLNAARELGNAAQHAVPPM